MNTWLSDFGALFCGICGSPAEWIPLSALLFFCLAQCVIYLTVFNGIPRWNKRLMQGKMPIQDNLSPVTIIVTANNQLKDLEANLHALLEQDYPEFQVVVVDVASFDGTCDFLHALESQYPHLYHTFVPADVQIISLKKMALTIGVKAAKYDYLLFTDADCKPAGNQWVKHMMRHFVPGNELVLGYKTYACKGFWERLLVTYANLFQSMRFLGMAAKRKTFMGDGQNLAYKKDLFFVHKGYASQLNIHPGEDDIFVAKTANKSNTRVEVSPEAVVTVFSENAFKRWWNDHYNRLQTMAYYSFSAKMFVQFEWISRISFYLLLAGLIFFSSLRGNYLLMSLSGILFFLRAFIQISVFQRCSKVLNERRFFFSIPFLDIIMPPMTIFLYLQGLIQNRSSNTRQKIH